MRACGKAEQEDKKEEGKCKIWDIKGACIHLKAKYGKKGYYTFIEYIDKPAGKFF